MNSASFRLLTLLGVIIAAGLAAVAQTAVPAAPAKPVELPTPGGKVVSPSERMHKGAYEGWHYAPARVEGSIVYLAGIATWPADDKPVDLAGLEALFRRAWVNIRATLEAAGSGTDSIVEMTTFHVFTSPTFAGTQKEHIDAFRRVKDEFVPEPYPAWTGIGVATLFPDKDRAVVEIRVIARLKNAPGPR